MKCSWNSGVHRVLNPRLALALAASAALHTLVVGGLGAPSGSRDGAHTNTVLAVLLPDAAAQERAASRPATRAAAAKRYYRTRELDVVPGIKTRTDPEFPDMARVSGKVLIRLFIDERGTVEHVAILRADPPGVFEASARRAFLAARFTPGMKAGVAVKSQLTLQVDYTNPK